MASALRIHPAAVVLATAVGLGVPVSACGAESRVTTLPDTVADGAVRLVLNGAGVLRVASADRYLVGLYLTSRQDGLVSLLADRGRKRIVIVMLRSDTPARLVETLGEGIDANHGEAQRESLSVPFAELGALLVRIGVARAGSTIEIEYVPGAGTRVLHRGLEQGGFIQGRELHDALLRALLGADPIDRSLRSALLGVGAARRTH